MIKFFNRPLAPHLNIYLPQTSSLFSIWHRFTAMFIIIFLVTYILIHKLFFYTFTNGHSFIPFYFYFFNYMANYLFYVCLSYHSINGIRHLLWDLGLFLTKTTITKTTTSIFVALLVLQIIFLKNYIF